MNGSPRQDPPPDKRKRAAYGALEYLPPYLLRAGASYRSGVGYVSSARPNTGPPFSEPRVCRPGGVNTFEKCHRLGIP